jgi:hypothetical protein
MITKKGKENPVKIIASVIAIIGFLILIVIMFGNQNESSKTYKTYDAPVPTKQSLDDKINDIIKKRPSQSTPTPKGYYWQRGYYLVYLQENKSIFDEKINKRAVVYYAGETSGQCLEIAKMNNAYSSVPGNYSYCVALDVGEGKIYSQMFLLQPAEYTYLRYNIPLENSPPLIKLEIILDEDRDNALIRAEDSKQFYEFQGYREVIIVPGIKF